MTNINSTNGNQTHSDLTPDHFILRALPPSLHSWAMLMRLDRPIGTWLLLLPSWWGILAATKGFENFGFKDFYFILLFGFGAIVMRAAGCIVNDLWDRDLDSKVERTKNRPLASGVITPIQAYVLLALLLWIGLIVLVQLTYAAIVAGCFALVLTIFYPLAKRITWYPQLCLGVTFNLGALMGYATITGDISPIVWIIYAAGIFWTLGYDTIYAHQDATDDSVTGIKSTALKFAEKSPLFVGGFYFMAAFLIYLSGMILGAGFLFYVFWAAAVFQLIIQWVLWNPSDPLSSLRAFRSNRNFGLWVFLSFLLA